MRNDDEELKEQEEKKDEEVQKTLVLKLDRLTNTIEKNEKEESK